MQNPIVSCAVYAVEMFIFYIFFSRILTMRQGKRRHPRISCLFIGLILFEAGSVLSLLTGDKSLVNAACTAVILFTFTIICFEIRPAAAIAYAIILNVIDGALELVSISLLSALLFHGEIDLTGSPAMVLTLTLVSKSLLLFVCLVLSFFIKPSPTSSAYPLQLLFYPTTVSVCLCIIWDVGVRVEATPQIQILCAVVAFLLFASLIIIILTWQEYLNAEVERQNALRENERLKTEKAYYDILDEQNRRLGIYAHDMKNQLEALKSLCVDSRTCEYLDGLVCRLNQDSAFGKSGNKMLDIIINRYDTACRLQDMEFSWDVRSCNLGQMDDMDLVAVLGNLMDNALEGAAKSVERKISLTTTFRNGYSVIIVENSCDTAPKTRGRFPATSKAGGQLHGYGLRSVANTLKKYEGDCDWEYDSEKRLFMVTAMLK